jgi:hypothetical protein
MSVRAARVFFPGQMETDTSMHRDALNACADAMWRSNARIDQATADAEHCAEADSVDDRYFAGAKNVALLVQLALPCRSK